MHQHDHLLEGSIRAVELFTYFNLELSGFEKSVFGVFDEGTMNIDVMIVIILILSIIIIR